VKNNVQKELEKWLPDEKIQSLEKNGDELIVFRRIANQKQRSVLFRDNRPHLLAENVHFIETSVVSFF
jgi:pre-rRNA-processing protein TSR1